MPEFHQQFKQTCLDRLGVEYPLQNKEVQEKAKATTFSNYGVEHPGQNADVEARAVATNLERRGVKYIMQSLEVQQKAIATNMARYGVPNASMNPEIARRALEAALCPGPNRPEKKFAVLCPELLYTGNKALWYFLPLLGKNKNPDFILPGPCVDHPKRGVTRVVELFGDYWHSQKIKGISEAQHEQETIQAYANIGIACLIIWEHELKKTPEAVRKRVLAFIAIESDSKVEPAK